MSDEFVRITGDDVEIWNGCSEQWAKMILSGYQEMDADDEVIQVDIYVQEGEYGHVSKLRDTLEAQLNGADPEPIVTWEDIEYRLGLSTEHAEELIEKLETTIEVDAHAHTMEFQLHRSTFEDLVLVLAKQWRDRERIMTHGGRSADGTDHSRMVYTNVNYKWVGYVSVNCNGTSYRHHGRNVPEQRSVRGRGARSRTPPRWTQPAGDCGRARSRGRDGQVLLRSDRQEGRRTPTHLEGRNARSSHSRRGPCSHRLVRERREAPVPSRRARGHGLRGGIPSGRPAQRLRVVRSDGRARGGRRGCTRDDLGVPRHPRGTRDGPQGLVARLRGVDSYFRVESLGNRRSFYTETDQPLAQSENSTGTEGGEQR